MGKGTIMLVVIIVLALILGGIVGSGILKHPKTLGVQGDVLILQNIKNIEELDLVSYYFEDVMQLDKNNNPKKLKAVACVPVTMDAYINMKNIQYVTGKNDSITKILLPRPVFRTPVFSHDDSQIKIIDVSHPFIQIGSGNSMADNFQIINDKEKSDGDSILLKAKNLHLLNQADTNAVLYVKNLLISFKHPLVPIEFLPDSVNVKPVSKQVIGN